jgi:hypothetical protein
VASAALQAQAEALQQDARARLAELSPQRSLPGVPAKPQRWLLVVPQQRQRRFSLRRWQSSWALLQRLLLSDALWRWLSRPLGRPVAPIPVSGGRRRPADVVRRLPQLWQPSAARRSASHLIRCRRSGLTMTLSA